MPFYTWFDMVSRLALEAGGWLVSGELCRALSPAGKVIDVRGTLRSKEVQDTTKRRRTLPRQEKLTCEEAVMTLI